MPETEEAWKSNSVWFPWTIPSVKNMMNVLKDRFNAKVIILFGEVFGGSIQNLSYGVAKGKGFGFRAFDLKVDCKYIDYNIFCELCSEFGVDIAPILYKGSFSISKVKELAKGNTTVCDATHIREGVVISPVVERMDSKIGRVKLKYINDDYLFSKGITDCKDI
jgi:RNA ligase (TIGR02306 family)